MKNISKQLTYEQVRKIALLGGYIKSTTQRKSEKDVTAAYKTIIRLQAAKFLTDWKEKGVPTDIWSAITVSSSLKDLVTVLNLKEIERDNPQSVTINNLASTAVAGPSHSQVDLQYVPQSTGVAHLSDSSEANSFGMQNAI